MDIDSIKKDFVLEGFDHSELRTELVKKLAAIHPDKNHGEFNNSSEKELFYKIKDAIEFIDKSKSRNTSLITLSEAKELMEFFTKQVSSTAQIEESSQSLSQKADRSLSIIRGRYKLPKITTTAVAAIISTLWVFPNLINEHPILNFLINTASPEFTMIWLISVLITGMLWLVSYTKEQRQEEFIKKINSKYFQNDLFSKFLRNHARHSSETLPPLVKEDFITELLYSFRRRNGLLFNSSEMDADIAESIADIVFTRAEEKGLIKKIESTLLEDQFILVEREV